MNIILIILFASSFVKLLTALNIFRYGLGLTGFAFGLVILVFSVVLSAFVIQPVLEPIGGIDAFLNGKAGFAEGRDALMPFIESKSNPEVRERLQEISGEQNSWILSLSAFMVSELKEAFYLGLIFIIPFIVIDFLVLNAFTALGVTQISASLFSLPFKLLLFYVADGWVLITEKLIGGYF